jgi:phenylacetate-CoA ligase
VRRTLATAVYAMRGDVIKNVRAARRWQWLGREEALALQARRLEEILAYAAAHVPHYGDVLREHGVVDDHGAVHRERLADVPTLTKEALRSDPESLASDDRTRRRPYWNQSGGSVGLPVRFIQDREYHDAMEASKVVFDEWTGRALGERQLRLWAAPRDLGSGRLPARKRAGRWLRNEIWLDARRMDGPKMRAYLDTIREFHPVLMLAYADAAYDLARFVEREGLEPYSPHAIMTSASLLTPPMRAQIERVFQCGVFDRYGTREVGDIACECERHAGLHVSLQTHYVEILRPDGSACDPGEVGEVFVTSLTNKSMPFIRYQIGDLAAWADHDCECGRGWPLLDHIEGRSNATFVAADGALVRGVLLGEPLWGREWVERFQIVQEEVGYVRILIEKPSDYTREPPVGETAEVSAEVRRVLGECRVEFEYVPELSRAPSGKYQFIVSKVAAP